MHYIGIDIGSACAKLAVLNEAGELVLKHIQPTGWSSVDTAQALRLKLEKEGICLEKSHCVATGYGRISVPYADKMVTEITCHARGAAWLHNDSCSLVIDIGGQDTKVIQVTGSKVVDFVMNDKCSAGTGRFLEVMGSTMGLRPDEICELARKGSGVAISSMCTVFAESEVVSLIGRGEKKENIAFAVVESTGGLCGCAYLRERLSYKLGCPVAAHADGRYAGAIGAALSFNGFQ